MTDVDKEKPGGPGPGRRQPSRVGRLWAALIAAAVLLILLLIFILQNNRNVRISFLGLDGELPLGVAMLLAAIAGALIIAIPGTIRILQLRRSATGRATSRE